MRNVTVAAVQMKCSKSVEKNIAHAEELVRQAAAKGAEIVLLPELFERPYFCQERRYEYYEYAQTAEENPAVRHFSRDWATRRTRASWSKCRTAASSIISMKTAATACRSAAWTRCC